MHKPRQITFYAPGLKRYATEEFVQKNPHNFLPISVTGSDCVLNCDHCGGQLLRHMKAATTPQKLLETCSNAASKGTTGVLVSGGCDVYGHVPLEGFFHTIGEIKKAFGLKIYVHSGLVDDTQARGLNQSCVDAVLIDIIGSDQTINEVYHLVADVKDYEASMHVLSRHNIPTMPHIVLGLHYGAFKGEYTSLEIVSKYNLKALVIVILTPFIGTPMQNIAPPSTDEVGRFFRIARSKMPSTPIILGCARPMGKYKQLVDRLAIDSGLDGIAFPADGAVAYARDNGLDIVFTEACCGLEAPAPCLPQCNLVDT